MTKQDQTAEHENEHVSVNEVLLIANSSDQVSCLINPGARSLPRRSSQSVDGPAAPACMKLHAKFLF